MNSHFDAAMRRALESTRAQRPDEATAIIQEALGGRVAPAHVKPVWRPAGKAPAARFSLVEPAANGAAAADAETGNAGEAPPSARGRPLARGGLPFSLVDGASRPHLARAAAASSQAPAGSRWQRPSLGSVVDSLAKGVGGDLGAALPGMRARSAPPMVPDGARYETRSFSSPAGSRAYRLYVPAALREDRRGLVVMLHGCTQSPDDFATGTRMNEVAEERGLIVAYPEQSTAHNPSACWNWFRPGDQSRGRGEPAILAGLTLAIVEEFGVDRSRVFVAGLSAGGAMAAVMAEAYPGLYAAAGIHSGLPCGSASDVASAFAAMRGENGWRVDPLAPRTDGSGVRTIVFHGAADRTVHPSNGEKIIARGGAGAGRSERSEEQAPGGRSYTRSTLRGSDDKVAAEFWLVHGAGHAWSGGDRAGSYTDPAGPDASREMVRFFLAPSEESA